MTQFIFDCLDLVFFPLTSTNDIVLIPLFLMVFVFIVRMFYSLIHVGAR